MSAVNALLRSLADALLAPFAGMNPLVGLTLVSLLLAVVMLLVFKKVSNQDQLERVKRQIHAGLFEMRLFNDDLPQIFRAQWAILKANGRYLALTLVPMVILLPLIVLVSAQLQFHYGYQGLKPGEPVLLTVALKQGVGATKPAMRLEAPTGLKVETPAVWAPALGEVAWRLVAEQPGIYEVRIVSGGEELVKTAVSSSEVVRRSPLRPGTNLLDQLLYPSEPPIPGASQVASIRLGYPDAEVSLLGWKMHWMIAFIILSIVFALALRRLFGVTI